MDSPFNQVYTPQRRIFHGFFAPDFQMTSPIVKRADQQWKDGLVSPGDRPRIIAHRGDSFHAPENTLAAARAGHRAGAWAWELDVQSSSDGALIVLHDDTLTRTTNVASVFRSDRRGASGYWARDFAWSEIEQLDAGSWFVAEPARPRSAADFGTLAQLDPLAKQQFASGAIRIPALEEALALSLELDWLVNVEIKGGSWVDPSICGRVLAAVESLGMGKRVLISSFDVRLVEAARALPGPHAVGLLAETLDDAVIDTARRLGADTLNVDARALLANRNDEAGEFDPRTLELLGQLRALGIPVLAYTVNDLAPGGLGERLAAIGVAGLFTDDPASSKLPGPHSGR